MTHLLFVYGSLRRGQPGPEAVSLHAGSRWLGPAYVHGHLVDVRGHAALVSTRSGGGAGRVDGELVQVQDDTLWDMLDRHEGVGQPGRRERALIVAIDERGDPRSAWTYVAAGSTPLRNPPT